MTEKQEEHVKQIAETFSIWMDRKYRKGAAEHGGNLFDMSESSLVDNAIEELIDGIVYLLTAKKGLDEGKTDVEKLKVLNVNLAARVAAQSELLSKRAENSPVLSMMDADTLELIEFSMKEAETKHGPLTKDPFRAMSIMGEEIGEVHKALLESRKAALSGHHSESHCKTMEAVVELTQVISVAVFLIHNLRAEDAKIISHWLQEKE